MPEPKFFPDILVVRDIPLIIWYMNNGISFSAPFVSITLFETIRFDVAREGESPEKLEKAGTVGFKKHPARKVGTRSGQCRPKVRGRFAFPSAGNPGICSILRFGKNFPAIFPGLSRSFPREPPSRPRKQPQPSRVFPEPIFGKGMRRSTFQ